jgi:predicted dehydrogenase
VFIHAVHHIDLLLWFMGMPASVTAVVSNVAHPSSDVEDLAIATLRYADGRLAQLTVGLVHHGEKQRLCFQGERAGLSVPWEVSANSPDADGFPEQARDVETELATAAASQPALVHTGHAGQIVDLLDAIDENRAPICTGRQGREALELITAIYASAADSRTVELPLPRNHPFYGAGAWQAAMAEHMKRARPLP